ncbi:MAG: hypothetical protein ACYC8V_06845 [Caulobacteraceae bacterium]
MTKPFRELRERLLRAGVGPRHVRRYLRELADHLADLRGEEEGAGAGPAEAQSAALARLGGIDALAEAMIAQRQLRSWWSRAPWALFGLGPVVVLAGAYFLAGLILWSGWRMFEPGRATPFVGRLHGVAILYFGIGRLDYFTAPILIGWAIGLFAARQRSRAVWPLAGMIANALIGGAVQFHAVRPSLPGAAGQVGVGFTLDLDRGLGILLLTAAPYLIWMIARAYSDHRPASSGGCGTLLPAGGCGGPDGL